MTPDTDATAGGIGPGRDRWPPAIGWLLFVGWSVLAVFLEVAWFDLWDALWIFAEHFRKALWPGFVAIASYAAYRCLAIRPKIGPIVLLAVTGVCAEELGRDAGLFLRLRATKGRYESVVASLAAGKRPAEDIRYRIEGEDGRRVAGETGPPVRIFYPWPGGILDNWCGIVHDPTGLVMEARKFGPGLSNWNDPALGKVKALFGGDLCYCKPLGGPWYYCAFT